MRWAPLVTVVIVCASAAGCPRKPAAPPPVSTEPAPGRCTFDPSGDVDCTRACAGYRAGFEAAAARGVHGEFMTPGQCPTLCARFNDPQHHAQPDTVIQWNCLAAHPMCAAEIDRCQRTCLRQAMPEREPAQFGLCLPPGSFPGA